jgi:Sulfite exporter TauE/SafE
LITTPELVKSILGGVAPALRPGGFLVPVISLLLPLSQHVIQGISLVVQAPPTGLSGLSIYWNRGHQVALRPVLFISLGFVVGGPLGAVLAKMCCARELQWLFVGYLLLLAVLAMLKRSKAEKSTLQNECRPSLSHDFQAQAWNRGAIVVLSAANRMLNEPHRALFVLKCEPIGGSSHKVSPGPGDVANATGERGELVLRMNHHSSLKAMELGRKHGAGDCPNHRKS